MWFIDKSFHINSHFLTNYFVDSIGFSLLILQVYKNAAFTVCEQSLLVTQSDMAANFFFFLTAKLFRKLFTLYIRVLLLGFKESRRFKCQ